MALKINLKLIHPKKEMCDAFEKHFNNLPCTVFQGHFEELPPHDCFVTAGNAYGIMNAGIDAAVVKFHGLELMEKVQQKIMEEYLGEQPLGSSMIIDTGAPDYPFIAHTPTMRVPGSIAGTDKVYQAMWASLIAIYRYNVDKGHQIKDVVVPALGTGWGCVEYSEAARQMSVAYRHYLNPSSRLNWEVAASRQKAILYDGKKRVAR